MKVHGLRLLRLAAAERHELLRERRAFFGRLADLDGLGVRRIARLVLRLEQLRRSGDRGEHVVEIVRDAAPAGRRLPFYLPQLFFERVFSVRLPRSSA
jgi:hypothetical protein